GARSQRVLLEIERPEFVVADLLKQAIRALPIGRERETHLTRGTDRPEVHGFARQVYARDAHRAAVLHRILVGEDPAVETGFLERRVTRSEVEAAHALF